MNLQKRKRLTDLENKLMVGRVRDSEGVWDGHVHKLWYIYTMEYYSAIKKNSYESVLMRWMKLEPIIQSEVSQKDKDQ